MNTREYLEKDNPKFSIIISAYNVEKYLQGVVDSILQQSFDDYEIIIVDDGSQKPCRDLCDEIEKTDSRIKVIHKENGGVSTARNAGIRAAKGEYIYFLDGDDRMVEDVLSKVSHLIGEDRPDVIAYTVHKYTNWEMSYVREKELDVMENLDFNELKFRLGCSTYISHNFYKRNFILDNSCYFDENYRISEDRLWAFSTMSKVQSVKVCKGAFYYHYEERPGSLINNFKKGKNPEIYLSQLLVNKKMFELCDNLTYDKYKSKKMTSGVFWGMAAQLVINCKDKKIKAEGLKVFKDNIYIVKGEWCTIHKYVFIRKIIGTKNFLKLMDKLRKSKNK